MIVLVHGAGSGAWIWEPVVARLAAQTIALDLPSSGGGPTDDFHTDAAHVRSMLDGLDLPVVVCGNSYGGLVITEAAAGAANVTDLVYLAAFMPDDDENVFELMSVHSTPQFSSAVSFADGLLHCDPDAVARLAMPQADPATAGAMAARVQPMAMGAGGFADPFVHRPAWKTIRSTYVVCSADQSLQPDAQRRWAKERATRTVEVPYDHCPQVSHPAEIAAVLNEIHG